MAISPSNVRISPWRAALAAAVAIALLCAAPIAAGTRTGGDPDTLSYFEQVVSDWQTVPAARATEYGLFYLFYNGGTSVNFRWGVTHPKGFKAAKAVIDYWLENGKIVAYLATVTAQDVPRLRILVAAGNVYLSTTNCWDRANAGSAPFGTGDRVLVSDVGGNFRPMEKRGPTNVVTYNYVWSNGANALQTDTLSLATPPSIHSQIKVKGSERFNISLVLRPLRVRPAFPLVNRSPKPPVPAPFCKHTGN